jgi:hypothetical protein
MELLGVMVIQAVRWVHILSLRCNSVTNLSQFPEPYLWKWISLCESEVGSEVKKTETHTSYPFSCCVSF